MLKLYEHNRAGYESAVNMLRKKGKAAVIHPTGTGKSFIGFKLCEDNKESTVCWLSPSEYIFRTQIENLKSSGGEEPHNIKFYTYAKLMLMSEEELKEIKPEYIILDEFHRCGAQMWGGGVKALLKKYSSVPILGLSATSVRYLDNQRDMADELFDGCIASEMTLGEAIVRGILNPPKYVLSVYSYQKDLERYEQRIQNTRSKAVRDTAERYLEALRRSLEKSEGLDKIFARHMSNGHGKYIAFCANVKHMHAMIAESKKWFKDIDENSHIYSVYSDDPSSSKSFADFKADESDNLRVLFCIDALNEGIHVDRIDGVILLRPTVSPIIYKQQIGRALSASGGSAVIFDIVNNFSGLYSISSLQDEMSEVVRYYEYVGETGYIVNETFKIIDEVEDAKRLFDKLEESLSASWEIMFNEAKEYAKEHGDLLPGQSYITKDGYRLGQWVITQRVNYRNKSGITKSRIDKLNSIGMDWRTQPERMWDEGYELAKEHYEKYGSLEKVSERLSLWLSRQRQKYRENQLTEDQINNLNSLGMVWEPEDSWEAKYEEARRYFERNGNLDIPATYVTENGVSLGSWYRSVKDQYRTGTLTEERKNRLEQIGMKWTSVFVRNRENYLSLARDYYREHGNLNINAKYEINGVKLGVWISTQRDAYRKGKLTEKQITELESIGMSWQRNTGKWEEAYAYAEAYAKEQGSLNPPVNYITPDGFALGAWVATQRRKYSAGKLCERNIIRLERLNITWKPGDENWNEGFEHAKVFLNKNGHLNIRNDYISEDGFQLGIWAANQRSRYKAGKLTEERVKKLENLGFSWSVHSEKWDKGYSHVLEYRTFGGNLPIPQTYVTRDGYPLGEWMRSQERRYRKGSLETEKIRKLAEIGVTFGA